MPAKQKAGSASKATVAKKHPVSLDDALKVSSQLKLLRAQRAFRLSTYVDSKDSKLDLGALDTAIAAQEAAFGVVKAALASEYGTKAVPFVLPISFTQSTAGGSGVCNAVSAVDASVSVEFSSLALLFDEYRVVGGQLDYMLCGPAGQLLVSGATTFSHDSLFSFGYDPADNTAATTTRVIAELKQHQLVAPVLRPVQTANTYVGAFEGLHKFRFRVTPVAMINSIGTGQWKPTSGSSADGYLKSYCATGMGTLNGVFQAGILYLKVEFRSRT